ncbi:MAG: hypothetical protein KKE62_11620 [Proteobacteria bacterium]|nr:hypothetical protein [Pseudomonadota bacterium]MBU1388925.1 hypothetical protein [Pseudomonadota bacterium]MBU1543477.1 hypothetical protein [Pseudomonadota bacterium]MBU2431028.1 hypothetical protein [Pseudomonadota bacterium]MBU2480231.1 hypothetical protein [Pseudomonadota bacterium]
MHKDINHITGILDTINQMQTAHIQSFETELMPDLASQLTQRKIQFDELKISFDLFISSILPHHTDNKEFIVAEFLERINVLLEQNKTLEKKIKNYKYGLQESIKEISRGRKAIGFYGSPSSSINKPRAINLTN